jgi:hypothetical protein
MSVTRSKCQLKVTGNFINFIPVQDQTGQGQSDALLATTDGLGLLVSDCRGQGYDSGANMKGQEKGIQARILHTLFHCVAATT